MICPVSESSRAKKGPEDKMFGSDEHRLALYVLHELGVVPEHFETRTLFNEDCPGIPQVSLLIYSNIRLFTIVSLSLLILTSLLSLTIIGFSMTIFYHPILYAKISG